METIQPSEVGELLPISLNETCVVGSVFYKDYQTPGSEGNIRGRQAIESLHNIAEKGCKAAIIIAEGTDNSFIVDLKDDLLKLGKKAENIVWNLQKKPGYSQARREAIELARSKYPETRAYIMQEIEKDITFEYEKFVDMLSHGNILVMMNRGVNVPYNENPWPDTKHLGANLPHEQFWGERYQNIVMANQERAAGLTSKEYTWDRLNGTRIIRNEPVEIGRIKINPADLMLLKYKYVDGYEEDDRKNKVDTYSAAIYNMIPILEALGVENKISEAPVTYWHSEEQKHQEENIPEFRAKRLAHKIDLPNINFDIVANLKEWKEEGKLEDVILSALKSNKVLEIKHFKKSEYGLAL